LGCNPQPQKDPPGVSQPDPFSGRLVALQR
jgi:hypothetical protein